MPTLTLRPLAVGLLAAGLLLGLLGVVGPVPAARADRVVHRDARHDVRESSGGRPGSSPARRRAEPDITRLRASYTAERLRLQVRVRQLSRPRNHAALVQIRTPAYTAGVYVTRIPSRGLAAVTLLRGYGHVVDCPGLVYRMLFPKGIVKVVVPRSCLDEAAWVRVGFALSWTTSQRALTDDALSPWLTGPVSLTRRLHAG